MDWKTIKKIDAHIHLLPQEVLDANPNSTDEFSYACLDDHLRIMNQYNIEQSVIMTFNDPYLMSMGFTVSDVHQNLKKMCGSYPGRYVAFADIDVRNPPDISVQEIEFAFEEPSFKGVKIHASNTGIPVDDAYYDVIIDYCERNEIPVAFHSYPSASKTDVCAPVKIKHVFERHPNIRAIICHLGGFQWEDAYELPAYFDISSILPDYVNRYGVYKTNELLLKFGTDKLFFATDWPCSRSVHPAEIFERYFSILNQMEFSDEEISNIAYYNIQRFLGQVWPRRAAR